MVNNIKWWLVSGGFVVLALVLFLVLGVGHRSASTSIGDANLADAAKQSQQVYSTVVTAELTKLKAYLNKDLVVEDKTSLTAIREQLLTLRVPEAYRDFHLRLVLKLSLLESILSGQNTKYTSQTVQGELATLAGEFTNRTK